MTGDVWTHVAQPLLAAQHGVVSGTQLRELGVSPTTLRGWHTQGLLVRLRRNALVDGRLWRTAKPWEKHALRARAFALDGAPVRPRTALSHHSALALHGIAFYQVDDLVHECPIGSGSGRRSTGRVVHAPVPADLVVHRDGLVMVRPPLACLQVTATFGYLSGLVSVESGLRTGAATLEELQTLVAMPGFVNRRTILRAVLMHADVRHESPGESLTAPILRQLGHAFEPQAMIHDTSGRFVARVDFLLREHRVVVEFDGTFKYSGAVDLMAEKHREDRLRSLGYEVVRLTWADLRDLDRVRELVGAACTRAEQRTARARSAGSSRSA